MKKEMRELYVEEVATHDGPESCVRVRKGDGEALTGVRAGRAIDYDSGDRCKPRRRRKTLRAA